MKWFWVVVLFVPVVGAGIAFWERQKKTTFLAHDMNHDDNRAGAVKQDIERANDVFRPDN